jgi:hypothetical protein
MMPASRKASSSFACMPNPSPLKTVSPVARDDDAPARGFAPHEFLPGALRAHTFEHSIL